MTPTPRPISPRSTGPEVGRRDTRVSGASRSVATSRRPEAPRSAVARTGTATSISRSAGGGARADVAPLFGTFRYVLALMVAVQHIWAPANNTAGIYAVFGFYVLSGYLMSLVLNEVYGFRLGGIARFLLNRGLRIYAPYLVVLAFAAVVTAQHPGPAGSIDPAMQLPTTETAWLANVTMIGLTHDAMPRLISAAWSLRVELIFYILMALLLARGTGIVTLWYGASLAYTGYQVLAAAPFDERYYMVEAASLPFSVGALLYFLGPSGDGRPHMLLAAGLFGANVIAAHLIGSGNVDYGMYASLLLTVYVVGVLRRVPASWPSAPLRTVDRWLGDLAYPIFLIHWPLSVLVATTFDLEPRPSLVLFLATLPALHVGALLVRLVAERPIEHLRDAVRGRRAGSTLARRVVSTPRTTAVPAASG